MKKVILLPILIFLPALLVFFSGDDWFHLRISQISSIREFLNFFSFSHTAQSAAFYRPLPTQVFFYLFQNIFGLNVLAYHLFVLVCFGFSLYLVYLFSKRELKDGKQALISTLIYGFSVSNFTRLYFLSSFQEIALVIFSLLCLLTFPRSKIKAIIFFLLALICKETAIVLPLLLILFNFKFIRKNIAKLFPFVIIAVIYSYFRFFIFGNATGDSYIWNFSPAKAGNTLMWYTLWSFGAPELLVDYVGSGFKILPKFFSDYPIWGKIILTLLLGTVFSSSLLFFQKLKKIDYAFITYLLFFFVTILPVLFLPSHKFTLELGLPLVGFSLAMSWFSSKKHKILFAFFSIMYLSLNLSMNYLTYTRHYSVSRGEISQNVFNYISQHYPTYPTGYYFLFINDSGDFGPEWGQSKQISQALSGSDFFKVFYKLPNAKVYYQDIPEAIPEGLKPIYLSTKQFLNQ